jgi:hypothetical protein
VLWTRPPVVGETHYPSAGYVTIDSNGSVSPIAIAAKGLGPADGFTSYKAIWTASEYIGQTCTLAQC